MLEKNVYYLKTFFPGTYFRPKAKFEIRFGIVPFIAKNEKDMAIVRIRNANINSHPNLLIKILPNIPFFLFPRETRTAKNAR